MSERETRTNADNPDESAGSPPPSVGGESVYDRPHSREDDDPAPDDALTDEDVAKTGTAPVRAGEPFVVGSAQPLAVSTLDAAPAISGAGTVAAGPSRRWVRPGDRIFQTTAAGSGLFVVILIALVAAFLIARAIPALVDDKSSFLFSRDWSVDTGTLHFGIVDLLWVTVIISLLAMVLAVPIAVGIALFITQYAPRRLARPVAYVVDLLAAIPSIIYGIWGIVVLAPALEPVQRALYHLGGFPLFKDQNVDLGTIFDGGVVLAIMILPIVTAIGRDVFERTPRENIEAALSLGATRWEMIRMAVLPYGRPGVISGSMLGLGRALGETIAVLLILSKPSQGSPFSFSIFNGGETFASKIANNAAEFTDPKQTGAYIAAGLVLFVLTFAVNAAARGVVNRRKEFS
jgi:phosphate transport system permease protein